MTIQDQTTPLTPARSGYFTWTRLAVSGLFLLNGTYMGAWAPKIPEFADRLGLGESALGLMIVCFGLGSLLI
ncbi:MFS transporter, partial [Rhizobium sp. TRM95111]|nr:MFS transporter [Rhizobium alarense]